MNYGEPIPVCGATLGCKTQENYEEPMSQNCHSVLQRTITKYYNVSLWYYSVLQSTTAVHTSYYKVLRVLHSMTPYYKILCRTTTYTMPYHNVLRRSTVSTTPVLFCTTKYYAVPKYYAVVQGTTPVLLCAPK